MQKIFLLLLMSGSLFFGASAQSGRTPPFLVKSLSGESIQQVSAETTGGNISVTGGSAGDARIEVYARGNHNDEDLSKEEIQKRLDEFYTFSISTANNKLTVIAKAKGMNNGNWKKGLSISFKIFVPQAVSTMLRTSGGNINLKNLSGSSQDFRTSGGNLDIDQVSGKVTGRTSGGNINVSDSKDELDLTTSGGNIDASNCHGNIRLSTSGGNLKLRLLQGNTRATTSGGNVVAEEVGGELFARTSGGNVRMRDLSCSLETSTSGGDIEVSMKALGKFITITNSSGDIDLELPGGQGVDLKAYASRVKASSVMKNFKGDVDEKHIDGSLNGGGIPVKLDGGSGRITIGLK